MSIVVNQSARAVTCIDIIKRAYRLIGVYSIGETPTSDEAVDGFSALNAMLDEWTTESLMASVKALDTITLSAGVSAYTLGESGDIVTTRPDTLLDSSYIEYSGVSYPMTIATLAEYNAVTLKNENTTMPFMLWYDPTFPNGTLTVFPTPTAPVTLKLWSIKPIGFANLTDTIDLPPAYENAITFNLALALAMEFSAVVPPLLGKSAALAKKKIKRRNYEPIVLGFRSDVPTQGVFNISTGMVQ